MKFGINPLSFEIWELKREEREPRKQKNLKMQEDKMWKKRYLINFKTKFKIRQWLLIGDFICHKISQKIEIIIKELFHA